MKKHLLIIIIVISCITLNCKSSDKLSVEGKLYKLAEETADCGIFAFAVVMEFEIKKVKSQNYDNNTILVIVPCPEFYGNDFFKIDKFYNLVLERGNKSGTDFMLIDDPQRSTLLKTDEEFWAIDITHK